MEKLNQTHKLNDANVLNLFPLTIEVETKKIKVVFNEEIKAPAVTILTPTHAKVDKSGT